MLVKRRRSQRKVINDVMHLECNKCFEFKIENAENFQFRKDTQSYRPVCKTCLKRVKSKYYANDANKEQKKSAELKRHYGITLAEYDIILQKQNGGCAICGDTEPNGKTDRFKHFSVDHCHETGKVRGLLCNHCNRGIGLLKDSEEIVNKAYLYLKEFNDSSKRKCITEDSRSAS